MKPTGVAQPMRAELHATSCTCRGGCWVLPPGGGSSPCAGGADPERSAVITLSEWRSLGRPTTLEGYLEASGRARPV